MTEDKRKSEMDDIFAVWDQAIDEITSQPETEEKNVPNSDQKKKQKKSRKGYYGGKSKKGWRIAVTVLLGVILLLAALSACFTGVYWKAKNHMTSLESMDFQVPAGSEITSDNHGKTISCDGKTYRLRTDTSNILLIGKNPDHSFSTVVVSFCEKSKSYRFMEVPASLLAIDYSSAMNFSDIRDHVSDYLCGIPIHGFVVLDMQIVDTLMETETDADTVASTDAGMVIDSVQMIKLSRFLDQIVQQTAEDLMAPYHTFEALGDSFRADMNLEDLVYFYSMMVKCTGGSENELMEPIDDTAALRQVLNVFYNMEQEKG